MNLFFKNSVVIFSFCFGYLIFFLEIHKDTAGINLLKFNNKNTGKGCKICSKLTIKTVSVLLTLKLFPTFV